MHAVTLRAVAPADLPMFFEHQLDPAANRMAAFTGANPADRAAFDAHWARLLANDRVLVRTILHDDAIAGHVASFDRDADREVTCWIAREQWGRGIATRALRAFLHIETTRPLHARAAGDNLASLRVLRKCGFVRLRTERGCAEARRQEIDEAVLILR